MLAVSRAALSEVAIDPIPPTKGAYAVRAGKPTVLLISDYYLPGYKAGGLIRSVANFVHDVAGQCHLWIVARDRDLGDRCRYDGIVTKQWRDDGGANLAYVDWSSPRDLLWAVRSSRRVEPDLLYLNSYMSPFSGIAPLIARSVGLTRAQVLLAPRGDLSGPALKIKSAKKAAYQRAARMLGIHRNVVFQASTPIEANDTARCHPSNSILISADCVQDVGEPQLTLPSRPTKLVQLGRVARIKNTHRLLEALVHVRAPLDLDIWGPLEDPEYWELCRRIMRKLPSTVRVSYRGPLEPTRVQSTLGHYHALVLCSLSENFGQVVAESLAAGCPVVVSKDIYWAEIVDGIAGWQVNPTSQVEMTSVLNRVAELPDEEWEVLRRGCATALRIWKASHRGLDCMELIEEALVVARSQRR